MLSDVFCIIDGETREPTPNPMHIAFQQDKTSAFPATACSSGATVLNRQSRIPSLRFTTRTGRSPAP